MRSKISNGLYKGKTLHELMTLFPLPVLGREEIDFPILIKLLDARENLSLQVHPSIESPTHPSRPKTEMWVILEASAEAKVYLDFKEGVDRNTFQKALDKIQKQPSHPAPFLDLIQTYPAKRGDVFFIKSGTIHALGEGIVAYEVSQNSDTTYRIYDWGRDPKGRPLHLPQALDALVFPPPLASSSPSSLRKEEYRSGKISPKPLYQTSSHTAETLSNNPYFCVSRHTLSKATPFLNPRGASGHAECYALFVIDGEVRVDIRGSEEILKRGMSCLIPACAGKALMFPKTESTLLQVSLSPIEPLKG